MATDDDTLSPHAQRVVAARQKLRARLLAAQTRVDEGPKGTGPANRHGKPKLPPGQTETRKWPVLDLGTHPSVTRDSFRLVVDGAVGTPLRLDFSGLCAFGVVEEESDFHCVTQWSRMDLRFRGVRLVDVLAAASPFDDAVALMAHGSDGYTTNVTLDEAAKEDVLLAFGVDGGPLPVEHGGPVRMITPQLWAWKGAKWICRLELLTQDRPGFWEERGYSMSARPWADDRYS